MKKFLVKDDKTYLLAEINNVVLELCGDDTNPCFVMHYETSDPIMCDYLPRTPYRFPLSKLKEELGADLSKEDWSTIHHACFRLKLKLSFCNNKPVISVRRSKLGGANGEYSSWQEAFDAVLKNIKQKLVQKTAQLYNYNVRLI